MLIHSQNYVVAASHSGLVSCFRLTQNELDSSRLEQSLVWSSRLSNRVEVTPAASSDGQIIFVPDHSGTFTALDSANGTTIWQYTAKDMIKCTPTIVNGQYVACGSYDRRLYVWNQTTGQLKWTVNIACGAIAASVAVIKNEGPLELLVATLSGHLMALSLSEGATPRGKCQELWYKKVSQCPIFASPLIDLARNQAIVGTLDESLMAFDVSFMV